MRNIGQHLGKESILNRLIEASMSSLVILPSIRFRHADEQQHQRYHQREPQQLQMAKISPEIG